MWKLDPFPRLRRAVRGLPPDVRLFALSIAVVVVIAATLPGCGGAEGDAVAVPGHPDAVKSSASVRAQRRAFDGAPPVIPHAPFGSKCTVCHSKIGAEVPGVGFAPALPHGDGLGTGHWARCRQCHVHATNDKKFVETSYLPLPQNLRHGRRAYQGAPPVIPHQILLRERCEACHTGPGAREEIRCSHPERENCRQCHLEARTRDEFVRVE